MAAKAADVCCWRAVIVALAVLLPAGYCAAFEATDAVSSEATVFNGPVGRLDAVSFECTVFNGEEGLVRWRDAISSELTLFSGRESRPGWLDTVSQELTLYNGEGRWLDAISGEFTVRNVPLGTEKQQPDSEMVATAGGVTARFPDSFYVEMTDRSSGIKVVGQDASPGEHVGIIGTIGTEESGERYIAASSVARAPAEPLVPLAAGLKSLWFASFHYDPDTHAGQIGTTGGAGLSTAGLLVTAWGRVVSPQAGEFTLDDGGRLVRCLLPGGVSAPEGRFVLVTGVVSLYRDAGAVKPQIRLRDAADLVVAD